ncbi:MAG: oxygenase MpaB family protein [Moraxellaceae bacterium]
MYQLPEAPHHITREQLLAQLEVLKKKSIDPAEGLFGPDTMFWEVNKHFVNFFGAGRAALLQLAHPWVANAVYDHSETVGDPFGRFQRTFTNVWTMVFGSTDQLLKCCIAVHNIHRGMQGKIHTEAGAFHQGSHYQANEVNSMLWVHATLWEGAVKMYEMFVRELTPAEKEQYYEESKLFAYCFGIREEDLPPTWDDFMAYCEAMWESDQLTVSPEAREIASYLFDLDTPLLKPALSHFRVMTSMLMPERLREGFGLPPATEKNLASFRRTTAIIRRVHPWVPRRFAYIPAYVEARRRLRGHSEPDFVTAKLNQVLVGQPALVS